MFTQLLKTIRDGYSGDSAKAYVTDIARYHRIQASPGYRAAARHVYRVLSDLGLEAEVIAYPATYAAQSWSSHHFQEWECTGATLKLLEPAAETRMLADYNTQPMSIIQRSGPFEGTLELVAMEDGTCEADYAAIDVTGKLVFTCKPLEAVRDLAIERHSAVGILSDWIAESAIRERWDLPDALQYTSFWWTGHERRAFGFVLTPREGARLRQLVRRENAAGRVVRVQASVKSRFYDGAMEAITALIPGQSDEEVVLVGHLCHPAPGGNDNASGAAATLEAARALQALIADGRLSRPRRSLRFLWIPEMSGTYAYLAGRESEIGRMVAGINMDMVGENQELCRSSFLIDLPPEAMPSFAGDLIEAVRDEMARETSDFYDTGGFALFRHATVPFGGGSDHYIFSDPTVGVPMPMLIQEPDKFYHTSADTLDKVDPRMLAVIGGTATAYAYWIANAGPDDARRLGELMLSRGKQRIIRLVHDAAIEDSPESRALMLRRVAYRAGREQLALDSLSRLSPGIELDSWKAEIMEFAQRELELAGPPPPETHAPDEWEQRAATMQATRVHRGPIALRGYVARLSREERDAATARGLLTMGPGSHIQTLAVYWADGRRSVLEVANMVEMECGQRKVQFLVEYFELLARLGLVRIDERKE
ncbi:MAG: DUF4910 domain-containing protein [Chloroflexi bacterium]|nr:DUF4910 domain-containing protein [Chloroflexota bacterium]